MHDGEYPSPFSGFKHVRAVRIDSCPAHEFDMTGFNEGVEKIFTAPNGGAMLHCLKPGCYIAVVNLNGKVTVRMQEENVLLVPLE